MLLFCKKALLSPITKSVAQGAATQIKALLDPALIAPADNGWSHAQLFAFVAFVTFSFHFLVLTCLRPRHDIRIPHAFAAVHMSLIILASLQLRPLHCPRNRTPHTLHSPRHPRYYGGVAYPPPRPLFGRFRVRFPGTSCDKPNVYCGAMVLQRTLVARADTACVEKK